MMNFFIQSKGKNNYKHFGDIITRSERDEDKFDKVVNKIGKNFKRIFEKDFAIHMFNHKDLDAKVHKLLKGKDVHDKKFQKKLSKIMIKYYSDKFEKEKKVKKRKKYLSFIRNIENYKKYAIPRFQLVTLNIF